MSQEQTFSVGCGTCRVAAAVLSEEGRHRIALCRTCGREDEVEAAIREAGNYLVSESVRNSFSTTSPAIRDGAIMITVTRPPARSFRWVAL